MDFVDNDGLVAAIEIIVVLEVLFLMS